MNNGKICISICAETAEDLIQQIKRAESLADIIEIRFDCLKSEQIHKAFAFLTSKKPLLLTYRPKEQGGKLELDLPQRMLFWNAFIVNGLLDKRKCLIDFEFDLKSEISNLKFQKIISFHNFSSVPNNLETIYESLLQSSETIKIAVQADDITDSIPIWKLIKKAKKDNKQIIPIAMGEAGKWTRILGLAHGAFMTYASLNAGQETAPGQVSVRDLIEVYCAKNLNEQTEIYGIIGGDTSYSMSPFMQNAAFKYHHLNAVFVPLQVQNLDEFIRRMVRQNSREIELNFKGFSVTIPHKQNIIKHLDEIDETARAIGAVNTVKIIDGKLYGYNTDAHGFISPLLNSYGDLSKAKVAVFGAGGAARACIYALKQAGADVTIFARDLAKAQIIANDFKFQISNLKSQNENYNEFDILVNTTPLGTKGKLENASIATAEQIEAVKLVYDLVYNPFQTILMSEADKVHVPKIGGMAMLVAQGMKQFEIWTGKNAPMKEMSQAVLKRSI